MNDNSIHFNETRYHEDNFFNNYVRLSGAKICEINKNTYLYFYNSNSVTNKNCNDKDIMELYLKNIKELLGIAEKNNYDIMLVNKYIDEKNRYLRNVYNSLSDVGKSELLEQIKNNDLVFFDFYNQLKN